MTLSCYQSGEQGWSDKYSRHCVVLWQVRNLKEKGDFSMPKIQSLENVLAYGIELNAGRVFADVWDLGLFSSCEKCIDQRTNRLISMNLNQKITDSVKCICDSTKPVNSNGAY